MTDLEPLIELQQVSAGYDGVEALSEVDLAIYPGDYLAIIGPNGGGKTTLLKVLLGLLEPSRGVVTSRLPHGRGRMGYVPQFSTLESQIPLRVEEVALMGRLSLRGLWRRYRQEDREAAQAALAAVRLDHLAKRSAGELSGGQLQRLLLARALAGEPEALLLDEPMASLDAESRQVVRGLLQEVRERMPIVLVTHDPAAVAREVRNIACMNRRLSYHAGGELTSEALEETYGCPVELLAHGVPHRVLGAHSHRHGDGSHSHSHGDGEEPHD
ncbi:MAG: ATP-binding cassette domain-containing protein [Deltaproteobacteria bacterium]|nr:ATP-binding cassette domain-containing protein [Deltaproteobacteria bacterium]